MTKILICDFRAKHKNNQVPSHHIQKQKPEASRSMACTFNIFNFLGNCLTTEYQYQ